MPCTSPTAAARRAWAVSVGLVLAAVTLLGLAQNSRPHRPGDLPRHEFQIARLIYEPFAGDNRRAWRPWWAIDYPEAEMHITQGLHRLTRLDTLEHGDSIHLLATDSRLFDYPWLFAQQVGRWYLTDAEAKALREYLLRGGFLVADDFHGPAEYEVFMESMSRVFPELPVVELKEDDHLLHVIYDISERTQIPGKRHLYLDGSGQVRVNPDGTPPMWKGILDEKGRLMVVMNFNMDMGDSWEHADDPEYPQAMTALGYRFGINYIMYAMTH
jgi:hypothetical protein